MSSDAAHRHTNRLANETSPYLLQHAHNPVDWYPWGEEALARARAEDKPILLSIGYSACHWCHVMERESFEDEAIAELMNRSFVSVKVDREERPDLDAIYMQAVQLLTQRGGWPMTVFLTPDGQPFWGGTYFPPEDRHGMPGFPRVLTTLAEAWRTRRDEIVASGNQLSQHLQHALQPETSSTAISAEQLAAAADPLLAAYDKQNGGFGSQPKFPQPMAVELLLRLWHRSGDERLLRTAADNLDKMARGGLYDHLGGGFHRYSTDAFWLVAHFEKMLYDNAQLARAYLLGYQATGHRHFRTVVEETLDYVLRDMTGPWGELYSTEDADSEGEEGRFYVWTPAQLEEILGADEARLFAATYGVSEQGNFEHTGASVLSLPRPLAEVAAQLGVDEDGLALFLAEARRKLFAAREGRVRPGRDDKVLAAWNGMMLRAFAEAARALDRDDYRVAAVRNAEFLLSHMRTAEGRLLRTRRAGFQARLNAYLEDYANVADGLVALYEATFDPRWLQAAVELADLMIAHHADAERGGFFDTSDDHEALITRPKDLNDNATPAGNSVAADVLLRLALLTGREDYEAQGRRAVEMLGEGMVRYPLAFARMLSAADFLLGRPKEVALVGEPEREDTRALASVVFGTFLPNRVVAGAAPGQADTELVPLLADRGQIDGRATAYVCEHYTCQAPVTDPEALRVQLAG